jgi:hypothetical protein
MAGPGRDETLGKEVQGKVYAQESGSQIYESEGAGRRSAGCRTQVEEDKVGGWQQRIGGGSVAKSSNRLVLLGTIGIAGRTGPDLA